MISLQTAAPISDWIQGKWLSALIDPITALLGDAWFGVLVGGSMLLSLWVAGRRDLAVPTTATMIFAPLLLPLLPSGFDGFVWAISLVGLTGSLIAVGKEYVLPPTG